MAVDDDIIRITKNKNELRIVNENELNVNRKVFRDDLLYPELSYQVIGILFEVSNKLEYKFHERYFQKAVAEFFTRAGVKFKEQVTVNLTIDGKTIAKGVIDFLIDGKIILEIKRGDRFLKQNIDQLNSYLKMMNIKLGILAHFTSRGLHFKRIVNVY